MEQVSGAITITTTGTVTLEDLPFTPDRALFTASASGDAIESGQARFSTGVATDLFTGADAMLANANYFYSRSYRNDSDRCIVCLGTPGGTITRVLDVAFVQFIENGIELNVLAKHPNYTFSVRIDFFQDLITSS